MCEDRIQIKRLDKSNPLPKYATPGSVGMDCYVRESVVINARQWALVPLGIVVKAPSGTFIGLLPRSSTFKKYNLLLANSVGVIDPDYCGEQDEVFACVYNPSDSDVYVPKGERLFQLIVFKVKTPQIEEVEEMAEISRGGFGSTGC